jgi:hypothetical protein
MLHETIKQEIVDSGILDGQTLASMHLAQRHLDEQIQVEGGLHEEQREAHIMDATSFGTGNNRFQKIFIGSEEEERAVAE